MIGSNERAVEIYHDIEQGHLLGGRIIGFINGDSTRRYKLEELTRHLGSIKDIKQIIEEYDVEEVIIALDMSEHEAISNIINTLGDRYTPYPDITSTFTNLAGKPEAIDRCAFLKPGHYPAFTTDPVPYHRR
jgi:FlaA1/EpsC-like NDP-sugar epimerase